MADLNKFQRSKDRIAEILNYLMNTSDGGHLKNQYIRTLQQSMSVIDEKMKEFNNTKISESRKTA